MLKRTWILPCLMIFGFLFSTTALAEASAKQTLETVANKLIARLESDKQKIKEDNNYVVKLVDDIIMPVTDFNLIGKRVLGRHWNAASEDQRQKFLKEFKLLLIMTYMAAFRSYEDQTIEFTTERANPNDPTRVEVRTLIREPGAPPIPVNYRLHSSNGWKVYDFNVDGVGLTSSFRSQFNDAITQKGLDQVIKDMKVKNDEVFK